MSIKKNGKTIAGNYTVANIKNFKKELAEATQEGIANLQTATQNNIKDVQVAGTEEIRKINATGIDGKQDKLTAGKNIKISSESVISATIDLTYDEKNCRMVFGG